MNWTTRADIRNQLQRLWDRGDILSSLVTGQSLFPRRVVLKCPTSAEMMDRFHEVRPWIAELRSIPGCRVVMREFRHRVLGSNSVPHEVWIDCDDDALALIGRKRDAARFLALMALTRLSQAELLPWLTKRPLQALELSNEWERLLKIVSWLKARPKPGIYLRQVDIPDVHTKFIETYRGVLTELLDLVLPADAVNAPATGANQFAQRYGFRDKPLRIRFRILDSEYNLLTAGPDQDITLDASSFAQLNPGICKVFITENEINFLAFPKVTNSLVIFGAGYGFEMLNQVSWLRQCHIYYWGDIDTHGFAILDQLRAQFDHVESFLMDRATLGMFESQWGEDDMQTRRDLFRLKPEERALYDDLRDNRLRKNLRLEQEKIGFGWLESALATHRL